MSDDDKLLSDDKPLRLSPKGPRFTAKCPLCAYTATALREGLEQQALLGHVVYAHMPASDHAIRS